jgi:hypothetical protein
VQVIEQAFEDVGDEDANGFVDYDYSGVIYRFVFPQLEFHARRYDDRPNEGHFLAYTTQAGERCLFQTIPYDVPEFGVAAAYLRDALGAETVSILLPSGYVPVDFGQFPGMMKVK